MSFCATEALISPQEQAQALRGNSINVLTSTTDLRDPDGIYKLVDETAAKLGPVDILVNNAGMQHVAPVHEFPNDKWYAPIGVFVQGHELIDRPTGNSWTLEGGSLCTGMT